MEQNFISSNKRINIVNDCKVHIAKSKNIFWLDSTQKYDKLSLKSGEVPANDLKTIIIMITTASAEKENL